jgi:hypothetical protein
MVWIWSWKRNRNRNFYKVGTGTITFSKVGTGTNFSKVGTGTVKHSYGSTTLVVDQFNTKPRFYKIANYTVSVHKELQQSLFKTSLRKYVLNLFDDVCDYL